MYVDLYDDHPCRQDAYLCVFIGRQHIHAHISHRTHQDRNLKDHSYSIEPRKVRQKQPVCMDVYLWPWKSQETASFVWDQTSRFAGKGFIKCLHRSHSALAFFSSLTLYGIINGWIERANPSRIHTQKGNFVFDGEHGQITPIVVFSCTESLWRITNMT